MEIKNIKSFLKIVELGSFSKAAETLGYTQSTISFQIQQLENELNCKLFDRIGRNVTLTDQGQLFFMHALKVNYSMEELLESFQIHEKINGTVRMYSSDSICERMMLLNYEEFYEKYPDIRLVFSTGTTNDMLEILAQNKADIIFTLDEHVYRKDYQIAKESPVQLVFVVNANHPLATLKTVTIKDLMHYPIILTEKGLSYRKVLDDHLAKMNVEIHPVLSTGRTDIITTTLKKGNAVSFLPSFIIDEDVKEGKLAVLQVKDIDLMIWKQLIYRKDKYISKALEAFIEFVKDHEFKW